MSGTRPCSPIQAEPKDHTTKQFSSYDRKRVTPAAYEGWFATHDGRLALRTSGAIDTGPRPENIDAFLEAGGALVHY